MSHDDYSLAGIQEVVSLLHEQNIPVVFNTSKTYAESRTIQQRLAINDPFIVENGSCLYLPCDQYEQVAGGAESRDGFWSVQMGKTQRQIATILDEMELLDGYYTQLSHCSVEQAVALTGLTQEQAVQAIKREFSEPIIWHAGDEAKAALIKELASHQLSTLQGGRFLHVLGQCDKGRAMQRLLACHDHSIRTIVLGDSANDIDMLLLADVSIVVNSPANHYMERRIEPSIKTVASAPTGWVEAINKVMLQISDHQETL